MSPLKLTFKWFGSLNSFWRSNDKKASKSTAGAGGFPGHGSEHGASERLSPVPKTVQDDMEAMRPRTASYIRSTEDYSHMCTLPRLLSKKEKGDKGDLKKSREKSNKQKKSQKSSGDQGCPPSTPTGVDEKEISTANGMELKLEFPPTSKIQFEPGGESTDHSNAPASILCEDLLPPGGLTDKVQSEEEAASADLPDQERDETQGGGCSEATPPSTPKEEDSKEEKKQHDSLNLTSHTEQDENQAENVQFSKEKYLLESPPEKLRKELEEELKLSPADIRSHGWYHGHIPQEVSETLVVRNGDFLVHDSLTNVGDFILTCRWDNEVLHFKISKVLVKSNETKVQYMLESDCFDSVQELVRFYVGQRKPLSQSCAAHIYCPVSRTLPLRYLEATFALASSKHGSAYSPSSQRGAHIKRRSVTMTDGLTTEKMIPHSDSDSPSPVETPTAPPEPNPESVPRSRLCLCLCVH